MTTIPVFQNKSNSYLSNIFSHWPSNKITITSSQPFDIENQTGLPTTQPIQPSYTYTTQPIVSQPFGTSAQPFVGASPFGQPSQPFGASPFGQPSQPFGGSQFTQPSQTFGASPFTQTNIPGTTQPNRFTSQPFVNVNTTPSTTIPPPIPSQSLSNPPNVTQLEDPIVPEQYDTITAIGNYLNPPDDVSFFPFKLGDTFKFYQFAEIGPDSDFWWVINDKSEIKAVPANLFMYINNKYKLYENYISLLNNAISSINSIGKSKIIYDADIKIELYRQLLDTLYIKNYEYLQYSLLYPNKDRESKSIKEKFDNNNKLLKIIYDDLMDIPIYINPNDITKNIPNDPLLEPVMNKFFNKMVTDNVIKVRISNLGTKNSISNMYYIDYSKFPSIYQEYPVSKFKSLNDKKIINNNNIVFNAYKQVIYTIQQSDTFISTLNKFRKIIEIDDKYEKNIDRDYYKDFITLLFFRSSYYVDNYNEYEEIKRKKEEKPEEESKKTEEEERKKTEEEERKKTEEEERKKKKAEAEAPLLSGYCSFTNEGNTCYMNSSIQYLFSNRSFIEIIDNDDYVNNLACPLSINKTFLEEERNKDCNQGIQILKIFNYIYNLYKNNLYKNNLFKVLNLSETNYNSSNNDVDLYKLLYGLTFNQQYVKQQEDASEFLGQILIKISYINDNIKSKFLTSYKVVRTCADNSLREGSNQNIYIIQLPLKQDINDIQTAINDSTLEVFNEGDDGSYDIECEDNPSELERRQTEFKRANNITSETDPRLVQWKRAEYKNTAKNRKENYIIPKTIKYINIMLKRFNPDLTKNNKNIIPTKQITIDNQQFKLKSILVHIGASSGGHYVTMIYDENSNFKYELNDSNIYNELDSPNKNDINTGGFIFLYERIGETDDGGNFIGGVSITSSSILNIELLLPLYNLSMKKKYIEFINKVLYNFYDTLVQYTLKYPINKLKFVTYNSNKPYPFPSEFSKDELLFEDDTINVSNNPIENKYINYILSIVIIFIMEDLASEKKLTTKKIVNILDYDLPIINT